ncbi:hypothetical protein [Romboutsia lituseburensis]|uniref:hypothetical protein n=1 Tax=Romboutsia lituseburensis TaxID=1537 RepID=UPI00215A998F|nr:hypothetical protein [Romboutsia lituseburensis]MCR8745052.1 hypothetical protein [Romboutsia lituseburensis]
MKKIKFFNSIRFRLIVVLFIMLIIPISVFSKVCIYKEKSKYISVTEKNISNHIATLDNILMDYISNVEDNLDYLLDKII